MNVREFFKTDKKGAAPIAILLTVLVVFVAFGVIALIYTQIFGGGIQVPWTGVPLGADGLPTTNASLEVSLFDPATNEYANGTIIYFKVLDAADVAELRLQGKNYSVGDRLRAGSSATTAGSVSLSNLSSSHQYILEVIPTDTTWFHGQESIATTASAGAVDVPIAVDPILNDVIEFSAFNNNGVTANTSSAQQAISASDKESFYVQMKVPSTTSDANYVGNGELGLLFQMDVNDLTLQSVSGFDKSGGDWTGMDCSTIAKISGHVNQDINRKGNFACISNYSQLTANTDYDLKFTIASTTLEPRTCQGADTECGDNNASIWVTLYDSCRVMDTRKGEYGSYWRDPVSLGNICATNYTFELYYK